VKLGSYTSACHFSAVDQAAIARACGCKCTTVTSAGNLGHAWMKRSRCNGHAMSGNSIHKGRAGISCAARNVSELAFDRDGRRFVEM
jgi:thiamine pyrophosphate-dependent acetolactate synthase large subunit-like protein